VARQKLVTALRYADPDVDLKKKKKPQEEEEEESRVDMEAGEHGDGSSLALWLFEAGLGGRHFEEKLRRLGFSEVSSLMPPAAQAKLTDDALLSPAFGFTKVDIRRFHRAQHQHALEAAQKKAAAQRWIAALKHRGDGAPTNSFASALARGAPTSPP